MCAVCHGAHGEGYKADNAPRLAQPDFQASVSDQYLREVINNGRTGTTMSAWSKDRGGPLSAADVEQLITFLRTWAKGPRVTLDERPLSGDAARGASTYATTCIACHGSRGIGGPNIHIGEPQLVMSASNGFFRYAIKKGRPGTKMPAFAGTLSDADIENITALLRMWGNPSPPPPPPVPPAPLTLGPVPLNPKGPEPVGFNLWPKAPTKVAVVHAQLARGARMVLLDARAPSDYMNQHIAGAVSVPFYDPDAYFPKLPKNSWMVCYCACPHAESGQLASKLLAAGFKKVTVLDEGIRVWAEQKFPLSTGDKP
jgi:cytochrome c oxidase cbb3-type subunit 3/ubiquinol-cytochrome c reductase cytochrome c subunit